MFKGIMWGLFAQLSFALGLVCINQVKGGDFFKSNVIHVLVGIIALPILWMLLTIEPKAFNLLRETDSWNWFYLFLGTLFLFILGDYLFIKGMSASNATAVSLTAMAFPVFAFLLEYVEQKLTGKVATVPSIQQIIGFILLVSGFVLLSKD